MRALSCSSCKSSGRMSRISCSHWQAWRSWTLLCITRKLAGFTYLYLNQVVFLFGPPSSVHWYIVHKTYIGRSRIFQYSCNNRCSLCWTFAYSYCILRLCFTRWVCLMETSSLLSDYLGIWQPDVHGRMWDTFAQVPILVSIVGLAAKLVLQIEFVEVVRTWSNNQSHNFVCT